MIEFGKWTKIKPGCEMPEESDEVLILLLDRGYKGNPCEIYEVDLGTYKNIFLIFGLYFQNLVGLTPSMIWLKGMISKLSHGCRSRLQNWRSNNYEFQK